LLKRVISPRKREKEKKSTSIVYVAHVAFKFVKCSPIILLTINSKNGKTVLNRKSDSSSKCEISIMTSALTLAISRASK